MLVHDCLSEIVELVQFGCLEAKAVGIVDRHALHRRSAVRRGDEEACLVVLQAWGAREDRVEALALECDADGGVDGLDNDFQRLVDGTGHSVFGGKHARCLLPACGLEPRS